MIMKQFLIGAGIVIFSLLITFIMFDSMSWYNFGDIPTKVVLIRLIIFFIIMVTLLTGILLFIKKLKK